MYKKRENGWEREKERMIVGMLRWNSKINESSTDCLSDYVLINIYILMITINI